MNCNTGASEGLNWRRDLRQLSTSTVCMLNKQPLLICLLLGAITLGLYWPAHSFDFLRFDDNDYVTQNTQIQSGLTREAVAWAFQANYAGNWHPLTWLSHMLDCRLYGLKPAGHHLTNILFHATNAMLLFLVLNRMTGAIWRSCIVAALFACHPAHVESVAWIAERKDVLSTFFGLLALLTYVQFAKKPGAIWYLLALLFFATSLMSKAMLVTLPCLLLLLDYWPLRRIADCGLQIVDSGTGAIETFRQVRLNRLLLEKIPFFVLSFLSCLVTIRAQHKGNAVLSFQTLPFAERLKHTPVSYLEYLRMAFWPTRLAVFYPHPGDTLLWQAAGAMIVLLVISAAAIVLAKRAPYLIVGWLWFLGTLVPVIGVLQVGGQSLADRYSYFPFTGLFIAVAWGVAQLRERWHSLQIAFNTATILALGTCVYLTSNQLGYWRNTFTLFDHARQVTDKNFIAYSILGDELQREGRFGEAEEYLKTSLSYCPTYSGTYYCLGDLYFKQGKYDDAIANLHEAVRFSPSTVEAYNEAGAAYVMEGKFPEAEQEFERALKEDPGSRRVRQNLGLVQVNEGKFDEAVSNLNFVLAVQPDSLKANLALAKIFIARGKLAEAVPHFEMALKQKPDDQETQQRLGMILAGLGKLDEAYPHLQEAARLNPADAVSEFQLGVICAHKGNTAEAIEHYNAVLHYQPDHAEALNNLAWIRAANEKAEFRSGVEAVQLAQRASEATHNQQPFVLGTLAAAYAEAGQFTNAVTTAKQARDLALAQNQKELAERNQELLQLYESGHAYHEGTKPAAGK